MLMLMQMQMPMLTPMSMQNADRSKEMKRDANPRN